MNPSARAPFNPAKRVRRSSESSLAWIEGLERRTMLSAASFAPAVRYLSSPNPRDMAIGDFNGDGKPDIVTVDPLNQVVAVLLNQGNGTFGPPLHFGVAFVQSVAVGDFNHDGKLDVALTTFDGTNGALAIYFGNGDGTFARTPERIHYIAGGRDIVAADFNGDGSTDVAITTANRIALFLNQGNGVFDKPVYVTVGNDHPTALAVGDFNGDGLPDLAVARGSTGAINILLNNPADPGTFGPPTSIPAGSNPLGITTGDFNGDGKLDLAVANSAFGQPALAVFLGNGDGTFRPRATYDTPNFADAVIAGDFSGTGRQDLVVGAFDGNTRLFTGNGDGTFGTSVIVPNAEFAEYLRAADFNGDGRLDLASTPTRAVRVSINTTGTITTPPAGNPSDVTIGHGASSSSDTFTAPDGTIVRVSLAGPGTATLHFSGATTIQVPQGRGTVDRTAMQLTGISAVGTTAASSLRFDASFGSRRVTVGSITTDGAFGSIMGTKVNLTGALSVPGGARQITLLSANTGSIGLGAGAGPVNLSLGQTDAETITALGPVATLHIDLAAGMAFTAPSAGSISVGRTLINSTIALTGPYAAGVLDLANLSVAGGMTNSTIQSAGNIGRVSSLYMANSAIMAGIAPLPAGQRLPATLMNFAAPASLGAVTLGSPLRAASFVNSTIAASFAGTLNLSGIQMSNGGVPFGIAAHAITNLAGVDVANGRTFRLARLTPGVNVAALLAGRGIAAQDFIVSLL